MKYKELPGFELNLFNLSDRICSYDHKCRNEGTIVAIYGDIIVMAPDHRNVHYEYNFRQCRKLEEIKARDLYIKEDHLRSHHTERNDDYFIGMRLSPKQGYIKVREVLED